MNSASRPNAYCPRMPSRPRPLADARRRGVLVLAGVVAVLGLACSGSPVLWGPNDAGMLPPDIGTVPRGVLVTPTGVIAPILQRFLGGWWVRTPCYGMARVRAGHVVDHVDVLLDPGHGGPEKGAVGPTGLEEREPNFAIATLVQRRLAGGALGGEGFSAMLTHPDAYVVKLHTRGEIAVALQPRAFVAIHHNSGGGPPQRGSPSSETFYQYASPASKVLAQYLWNEAIASLSAYDIEWTGGAEPMDAPARGPRSRVGEHGDYYGILRYSAGVPAVIIEASFTSNPAEEALQRTAPYRETEAGAITRAITRYLDSGTNTATPPPPDAPPTTVSPNGTEPPGIAGDDEPCTDPPLE
jgi:N-acetylmuramoyl-L-alanine amidase